MAITLPTLRLAAGELEATFDPAAGMLGCSLRHRGEEVLGAGGIPILHPWANRLPGWGYGDVALDPASPLLERDDNGLPIHGVLRACQRWEVAEAGASSLRATLDFAGHDDLLAVFPFEHRLDLDVRVSARALVVTTTLSATGAEAVPVSFGFHPYFRLPGVARADWVVELPERMELDLDARQLPTGTTRLLPAERRPLGVRVLDQLYRPLGPAARFAASGGGRRIVVEMGSGFPYAQVYAPAHLDVVCFEPMTAPVAALAGGRGLRHVAPGDSFAATFSVGVDQS